MCSSPALLAMTFQNRSGRALVLCGRRFAAALNRATLRGRWQGVQIDIAFVT
jgi:hypothetical protein